MLWYFLLCLYCSKFLYNCISCNLSLTFPRFFERDLQQHRGAWVTNTKNCWLVGSICFQSQLKLKRGDIHQRIFFNWVAPWNPLGNFQFITSITEHNYNILVKQVSTLTVIWTKKFDFFRTDMKIENVHNLKIVLSCYDGK